MVLKDLKPARVWHYFEALSNIPRESGNEKAVSDYLLETAKSLGLDVIQEPSLNIIIKKPASEGYENAPGVILQGHMDMVCIKDESSQHDFLKDPIPLMIDGDHVTANGTTLGADNGIAVAMSLAILEDKSLKHPSLTVLVTTAEETGMDGAVALMPENVPGEILINLDSEEEGVLLTSNAGGANVDVVYPVQWIEHGYTHAYCVTIKGLKGGHSGIEIDKKRGNAIQLAGRLLSLLPQGLVSVFGLNGGEKMNAIAKFASIYLASQASAEDLLALLAPIETMMQEELAVSDEGLVFALAPVALPEQVWSLETQKHVTAALRLLPQGVQAMSQGIEGLVETSNNIGVMKSTPKEVVITNALRSAVKSKKEEMISRMTCIATLTGGHVSVYADYPEWPYRLHSPIRDLMHEVYKEMTGQTLAVTAIHAGLECGLLKEKLGDLDMISLGPNMHDVHTPHEWVSISSTERVYDFLIKVLARIQ